MGIFSKQPAASELKAFATAEQRLQAVADKLSTVQRDLAEARSKLSALRPAGDLEDIDAAAQRFAAEHGALHARVVFLQHARDRLTGDLAQARRAVLQAETAIDAALRQHFADAAADRLTRLAGIVGPEIESLAVEQARADGSPHSVFTMDSVLSALADAIAASGKVARNFGIGLAYAETTTAKVPPAPRSALLSGDHRAGRDLDRLNPVVDAQAIRANLSAVNATLQRAEHDLVMAGRDLPPARRRDLEQTIGSCRQSRAELVAQLAEAEEQTALAA